MKTQNLQATSGFSLIELMVVIAIVALLAAVAVPSYRDYVAKARMAEIYGLLQNQLDYLAQSYSTGSTTARILLDTGLDATSGITATPTSSGGTVVIRFAASSSVLSNYFNNATQAVVTYTATDSNGVINWTSTPCTVGPTGHANKAAIQSNFFPACTVL